MSALCFMVAAFVICLGVLCPRPAWALSPSWNAKAQGLAHYMMGVCHDLKGEEAQAVSEYQKSVQADGNEATPRLRLGAYDARLDRIKEAVMQLKAAARLDPQDSQPHYLLALIYSSQQKFDLAAFEYETILKQASRTDPDNVGIYTYLGQFYYAQQKYNQAIEQFLKVLKLRPADGQAYVWLGAVYLDSGENAKAVTAFRKVLQLQPNNGEALNSLAYMYAEQGVHLKEALHMARKAVLIAPAIGAYEDTLGWVLYKKKQYPQALVALKKAAQEVNDSLVYKHIGDVYQAMKNFDAAINVWKKSLQMDGHQPALRQKIRQLEQWTASHSAPQPK